MVVVCVYCFRLHYISQMFDVTSVGQKKNYNNYNYLLLRAAYLFVRALVHIHCFMLPSGPLWRFHTYELAGSRDYSVAWGGRTSYENFLFLCIYFFRVIDGFTARKRRTRSIRVAPVKRQTCKIITWIFTLMITFNAVRFFVGVGGDTLYLRVVITSCNRRRSPRTWDVSDGTWRQH